MQLDAQASYRALAARDVRFDGVFFVGVKTTGIYCRPICPARTPGAARCEFFERAAEAERAGFRACFRCRPELAPGLSPVRSVPRLVRAAVARIEAGYLNEYGVEELAQSMNVTSRHLCRAMETELGITPVELAQTRRLALAKQLLQDTALSPTEIAFAAGFSSVRRFNALVLKRFGRPPSALRKGHGSGESSELITLRLDFRPPFDWQALLRFLAGRAIPGVETVTSSDYRRTVTLGDSVGWLAVGLGTKPFALEARVSLSLAPKLTEIVARLRALFDLDARPDLIAKHLRRDSRLRPLVSAHPGLRVPGAFDGFEMAVRAVLGQQISVRGASTLCGRLVSRFGASSLFPTVDVLANASVSEVQAVGLPLARARTLVELARAVAQRRVDLSLGAEPEQLISELQALPGVGPWTAHYLAMRVSRWPNAFPGSDLALCKALSVKTAPAAEKRAAHWQPWRAYGVMHLWNSLSQGG